MRIGIFDSGLGGLTVLRRLLSSLPDCTFAYFGDTAHLPYGSKSPQAIQSLTEAAACFLESQGIDVLVIACHTASAWAGQRVKRTLSIPVFDMITPTLELVKASSYQGAIGVLGTRAMIRSNVYPSAVQELGSRQVISLACPLFVPLIEEGLVQEPVCKLILRTQLESLKTASAETVVLGCTHYPILLPQLREELPLCHEWIDPAQAVANAITTKWCLPYQVAPTNSALETLDSLERSLRRLTHCWVTDDPAHFMQMSATFLGRPVQKVQLVDPVAISKSVATIR